MQTSLSVFIVLEFLAHNGNEWDEEVANKQVILKNYVISCLPKKSDVEVIASTIKLKVPEETPGILVKNLYLSYIDSYMPGLVSHSYLLILFILLFVDIYIIFPRTLAQTDMWLFKTMQPLNGNGVAGALDSGHPDYRKGDLIWEEHSLITETKGLFKIQHTGVPLSYYNSWLVFFFFCI